MEIKNRIQLASLNFHIRALVELMNILNRREFIKWMHLYSIHTLRQHRAYRSKPRQHINSRHATKTAIIINLIRVLRVSTWIVWWWVQIGSISSVNLSDLSGGGLFIAVVVSKSFPYVIHELWFMIDEMLGFLKHFQKSKRKHHFNLVFSSNTASRVFHADFQQYGSSTLNTNRQMVRHSQWHCQKHEILPTLFYSPSQIIRELNEIISYVIQRHVP